MEMQPPRPAKTVPELPPDTYTKRWHAAFVIFEAAADGLVLTHAVVKTSHDPLDVAFRKKVVTALENKDMEKALRKAELAIPGAHLNNAELGKLQFAVQDVMSEYFLYEKAMTQVIVVQGHPLSNASATHYLQAVKTLIAAAKAIHQDLKQEITKARMAGVADEQTIAEYKKNAALNITKTKTAVANAMIFITAARKAKAEDRVAFFNAGIQKAARDITTQLGTLDKLAKQGFKFDRAQPQHIFDALSPWASFNRQIGAHGGDADFDTEVAAFEHWVRAAGDWAN